MLEDEIQGPRSQQIRSRGLSVAADVSVIVAISVAISIFQWLKLDNLVYGDSVRWLLEAYRQAHGEVVYRDFSFPYPPLGLWVVAWMFQLFGSSFAVAQLTLDVLSCALCLVCWMLARRLLPRRTALVVVVLMALGGASNIGNFALFSLRLYAPSLLTGLVGILAFTIPLVDGLRSPGPGDWYGSGGKQAVLFVLGPLAACLSKIEFALAIPAACLTFSLLRYLHSPRKAPGRALARALVMTIFAVGPSVTVLALVGHSVGKRQLFEALGCYGVARKTCPWWPTGLGLLSTAAVLARGLAMAAVTSLVSFRRLSSRWGWRYHGFLALSALGLLVVFLQTPYAIADFGASQFRGTSRAVLAIRYFLSLNGVLLPVMWGGIGFFFVAIVWIFLRRPAQTRIEPWILLLGIGLSISGRSLFGDLFGRVPIVAQSAYPIWFIVAGGMGLAFLGMIRKRGWPSNEVLLAVVLLGYGGMRMLNQLATDRASRYQTLETEAGPVRLRSFDVSARLYHEVLQLTTPSSRMLEVPFGGGMTFASHRKSSLFLTIFSALYPSPFIEELDVASLRRSPPALVIAMRGPGLGSSKGLALACGFPHFDFKGPVHEPGGEPPYPSLVEIEREYRQIDQIGDRIVLVRPDLMSPPR